jgi:tetratricopeptide (TPR) repeat protein
MIANRSRLTAFLTLLTVAFACGSICGSVGPAAAQDTADDTTVATERTIDPERAQAKVNEAREAAGQDRHHEAVSDYLEALASDATLVPTVAQEIAYQKLWREDAEQSIFYFRRYLARHPDRDNRDVRKGLALAYSWSGRQAEAIALYRELVQEDPTDGGARIGLGRSLIWDNRLHEGFTVVRGVEDEFSPETGPGRESSSFLLTVLDGYTPHLEMKADASWDSDDLDIYRITATGTFNIFGNKLVQAIPVWETYRQPGQADITNLKPGAGIITGLARNWSLHAYGWYDRFRSDAPLFGGPEKLKWDRFGGDFWITWIAQPKLRIDFGGTSKPVETFAALNSHIGFKQANLSTDWRFARHFTLGVSGQAADYSDGNEKLKGGLRVDWRKEGRWEVIVGPVFTYMDFSIPYPGQYWAPGWVRNGSIEAALKTRTERMTFKLNGSLGVEKEIGADSRTVGGASGRIGWRFSRGWLAALEGGYSKSSFATASGYSRTFASLSVRALF